MWMSKLGMPSCTAQTMVPPRSGCSAACRGAYQARMSPNTTASPSMYPEYQAPWRTRRCRRQGRKLRMGNFLLAIICLVHVGHCDVLHRPPEDTSALLLPGTSDWARLLYTQL